MKKMLYIGHAFHKRTHSVDFLLEIFRKEYEISQLTMDPYVSDEIDCSGLSERKFDLLVCLQVMPSIRYIQDQHIEFAHGAFFPMADYYYAHRPVSHAIWDEYRDFQIICFSKAVWNDVREHGFSAHYFQYFPKPVQEDVDLGNPKGVFFWQRVTHINPWTMLQVLAKYAYDTVHMHYVLDPGESRIDIPEQVREGRTIIETKWFDTREEMTQRMRQQAIYMAPRYVEGIGMSFLEAMANGRCVIAENQTTMNEYITQGETGFLYVRSEAIVPLDIGSEEHVRAIQRKTLAYIRDGYAKWERERLRIPEVCRQPVVCTPVVRKTGSRSPWHRLVRNIMGTNDEWEQVRGIRLCGVPIVTFKQNADRTACRWEVLRFPVYESREENFR